MKLVQSQLNFMQSFVEDLFDLRQLREGVFALKLQSFDPNKVFKWICKIYDQQTTTKEVLLTYCIVSNLETLDKAGYSNK